MSEANGKTWGSSEYSRWHLDEVQQHQRLIVAKNVSCRDGVYVAPRRGANSYIYLIPRSLRFASMTWG